MARQTKAESKAKKSEAKAPRASAQRGEQEKGKKASPKSAAKSTSGGRSASPSAKRGAKASSRGEKASRTARRGKWINSVEEHEDRPGQSLITQSHEVIQQWAEERGAKPATVPGTEHEGRAGVLRFDFPGYGGRELQEIDWGDWFRTFDQRELLFIYQEHKRNGVQSNFFQLDNPNREDG